MPRSVPGLLALRPAPSRWLLLNKLPLSKGAEFWSPDNLGPAVAPIAGIHFRDIFLPNAEMQSAKLATGGQAAQVGLNPDTLSCPPPLLALGCSLTLKGAGS